MRTIEHEGQTYILKSSMEEIIRERVAKVATRANEAEQAAKDLQERLQEAEKKTSSADILASRVEQLQAELDSSKSRYDRYQAISKHGLVDEDMVEAVEWSYERSQKDVAKKDRKKLGEWLEEQVANPDQAHALLRPHLHSLAQEQAAPIQGEEEPPQEVEAAAPPPSMPAVNNGAVRPPSQAGDIIDLGLKDPEFYSANRDKIQAAWRARNSRR
jgi:hypothetical protein